MTAAARPPTNSATRSVVSMLSGVGTQSRASFISVNGTAITRNAAAIAMPPARGIGRVLTRRASGRSTIPYRRTVRRTSGVSRSAIAAVRTKTTRIGPTLSLTPSMNVTSVTCGARPARSLGRQPGDREPRDDLGDLAGEPALDGLVVT